MSTALPPSPRHFYCSLLLTKHCRLIFRLCEQKGLIFFLFLKTLIFSRTIHPRANIVRIYWICLRLITFHIDTLKGIRIRLVKQKRPFSLLFYNKFGLYKEKHFFIQNYLTIQLLKSCGMHQYSSLAQGLSSYLSIFNFKGFLISSLHIIYKI